MKELEKTGISSVSHVSAGDRSEWPVRYPMGVT